MKPRHSPEAWDDLQSRNKRMLRMIEQFKARETFVIGRLTAFGRAVEETNWARAGEIAKDLLTGELKEAVDYAADRELALRVAIEALKHAESCDDRDDGEAKNALAHLKRLAPEAFEPVKNDAASGVAS